MSGEVNQGSISSPDVEPIFSLVIVNGFVLEQENVYAPIVYIESTDSALPLSCAIFPIFQYFLDSFIAKLGDRAFDR